MLSAHQYRLEPYLRGLFECGQAGFLRFLATVLLFGTGATSSTAQETGFLTVQSEPEGAVISINGVAVGRAPYVNAFIETGVYSIAASNGPDFPVQNKTVAVGAVEPVEVSFTFKSGLEGDFIGQKIEESRTEKKTGNVQIGSVPLGAEVIIAGASAGQAPFGYTQVEVGFYDIVFQSGGREIAGGFCIIAGETAKVVANFQDGSLVTNLADHGADCGVSASAATAQPAALSSDPVVLVETLQTALKSVGCQAGVSDGIWGKKTKAAFDKYNAQRAGRCDALQPMSGSAAKDFNIFTLSANISALSACDVTICTYEKPPERTYYCTGRVKSSPERNTIAFKQYRNATSPKAAREGVLQTLGKSGWIFTSLKCEL
ncbi:MAG: PEGA domain-containing protein [Pseudomonadota bacterium]